MYILDEFYVRIRCIHVNLVKHFLVFEGSHDGNRKTTDSLRRHIKIFYNSGNLTKTYFKNMNHEKRELYTAKRPSGVDVSDPAIQQTWAEVRADGNPKNYILLGFAEGTKICVKSTGNGGWDEMKGSLSDEEILFGALRVQLPSGGAKFFHFFFVGSNVSAMKKGKSGMFKSGVLQSLEGAHGEINLTDGLEGATTEAVMSQILKLTGVANASDISI